ncbi:MAG: bacteriohemerythrin [Vallitaleaceae bacterium]|nr:bacteriohemerythrin [Vallitaleaceae bacterium]
MFEWTQEYAFGLDDIDKQHQKLFAIGHNLELACDDALRTDLYEALREAILELDDYSDYHFDYEEEWLLLVGYKGHASHQEDHDFFTAKIAELRRSCEHINPNTLLSIRETLSFLARWIVHHVLMVDLEYVESVKLYREKHTSLT